MRPSLAASVRSALALATLCLGTAAAAGPIGADEAPAATPDAYELALRWTMASLAPLPVHAAPATPPVAPGPALPTVMPDAGVPNPLGYALMGAVLLGAGLAAQRLSARQRGFSKKT